MTSWRTRQRNELANDMVKQHIKMWFMRNGKLIHAVPTLQEAHSIANDMQTLLDVANGDVPMDAFKDRKPQ